MRSLIVFLVTLVQLGCYASAASAGFELAQGPRMRQQRGGEQNYPPGEKIVVDGRQREYFLHLPARAGESKLPLVIAMHGGEGHPLRLAYQTGFDEVADRNGFAVVYPSADGRQWNDGRTTTSGFGDDVEFIRTLIDHLVESENIDPARVYATGPSNGGAMTLRLACELPDQIAAFAPVSASFPDNFSQQCRPSQPVSIMMIHGSEDRFIRWEGGEVPHGRERGVGGVVVPVPETLGFWRSQDGCRENPQVKELPDRSPSDGTRVEITRYEGCRGGAEVVLVRIMGGGHTWPGSRATNPQMSRLAGRVSEEMDGSAFIWDFFREHTLSDAPRSTGK
jgi:polyhydroxybutyrate depolymerase